MRKGLRFVIHLFLRSVAAYMLTCASSPYCCVSVNSVGHSVAAKSSRIPNLFDYRSIGYISYLLRKFWIWGPMAMLLTGCGTVVHQSPAYISMAESVDEGVGTEQKTIRMIAVINATGEDRFDDFRYYIHIKTAQALEATRQYTVVADDFLDARPSFDHPKTSVEAGDYHVQVELAHVRERMGAPSRLSIFSSSRQRVEVDLRMNVHTSEGFRVRTVDGSGSSTRGAWGVLAQVDREAILQGDGVWKLDNSMLGMAAAQALEKIAGALWRKATRKDSFSRDSLSRCLWTEILIVTITTNHIN